VEEPPRRFPPNKEAIDLSEVNLVSPLLDGFSMGDPISDHDGVVCRPAIKENTDQKYIVKVISIPASQAQMDALLLTGAYSDPADAMEYFRHQGEEIMKEAESLQKLARLDGFLSYDSWQMEPITRRRLGYQVYLVSPFRQSFAKYVRSNPVTHLEAMNLGLDLCSALSLCRQAGAVYVDLKPTNIFLSPQKQYRIGDLGFVPIDALSYTVIPDKYRSVYTPPELHDPMASMNMTVDTYAVGMLLYQLYNDGQLPFQEKAPQTVLPSPINADYELAAIIMQAIHPDPFQRWNDPKDLGQALRDYMQRNTVNDEPITLHTPLELDLGEDAPAAREADPSTEETSSAQADETAPGEEDARELLPHEVSEEVSQIVAKADDLISHEPPAGVVLPEIPEPEDPFAFAKVDDDAADDLSDDQALPVEDEPSPEGSTEKKKTSQKFISPEIKRRKQKAKRLLAAAAAIAVIGGGSFLYYRYIFQLHIQEMVLSSTKDSIHVRIESNVSDALLKLTCTDSAGKVLTQALENGRAQFTGLNPDSTYTVTLQPEGFHAIAGPSTQSIDTAATTNIRSFTGLAGSEDGSVVLSFTVEGDEPDEWILSIAAEGEESRVQSFTDHGTTVTDLTVGKLYTFTLSAANSHSGSSVSVSGATTLEYLASRLILAQDVAVDFSGTDQLLLRWKNPGDAIVNSWNVRCYNENGFDESVTVTSCEATFNGIDPAEAYTVQVTAEGMTQPTQLSITPNAISVSGFTVSNESSATDGFLALQWDAAGKTPEGGWLLSYSIDGAASSNVIRCDDSSASVEPRIPGAVYQFSLAAADETTVYGSTYRYECPKAADYSGNRLSAADVESWLLKTPDASGRYSEAAKADTFTPNDGISLALHTTADFYRPSTKVTVLYVIRDFLGNAIPELTAQEQILWSQIWDKYDSHYGYLDVPHTPLSPGEYTLDVYIDGAAFTTLPFHIE